jgi:hypothetical protein
MTLAQQTAARRITTLFCFVEQLHATGLGRQVGRLSPALPSACGRVLTSAPPTSSQPPAWPRPPNSLWALTFGHPATRPMFWEHIEELHKHRLPQYASLHYLAAPLLPGPSFIDASLPPCKSMTSTPAPGCRTTVIASNLQGGDSPPRVRQAGTASRHVVHRLCWSALHT